MKLVNNIKKFISLFTDRKIFINKDIDLHNNSSIVDKKEKNNFTPKYKLRENIGSFELYGTTRDSFNILKYKLIHKESNTTINVTEKLFRLLFQRE